MAIVIFCNYNWMVVIFLNLYYFVYFNWVDFDLFLVLTKQFGSLCFDDQFSRLVGFVHVITVSVSSIIV